MLLARGQAGLARRAHHVHDDRLVGPARAAGRRRRSPAGPGSTDVWKPPGQCTRLTPQRLEASPAPQQHVRVDDRHLHRVGERLLLRRRAARAEVRDQRVPAGQHAARGADTSRAPAARVGRPPPPRRRDAAVRDAHHRAVEADAGGRSPARRAARSRARAVTTSSAPRPGTAAGMSARTSSRASVALPSGKWKKWRLVGPGTRVEVHARTGRRLEAHAREAGKAEAPGVLARTRRRCPRRRGRAAAPGRTAARPGRSRRAWSGSRRSSSARAAPSSART